MGRYKFKFIKIMKKLSLLKLNEPKALKENELKVIKGGSCNSHKCTCTNKSEETSSLNLDDEYERQDYAGYN